MDFKILAFLTCVCVSYVSCGVGDKNQKIEVEPSSANINHYTGTADCACGTKGSRIVGGEHAKINEFPWTALLVRRRFFGGFSPYCGGTLVNNRYVVTASHCVDGMNPRKLNVILNEEDHSSVSENSSGSQKFDVEEIIMHPEYSRRTIDNDIALIKLATSVAIDNLIIPACLPADNRYTFEGLNATVLGWGATSQGGSLSRRLRKVVVPIISNEVCNSTETTYSRKITKNMLCAGYLETGQKDACQGDSGGPLVVENGGRKTLVGVVSWGKGCARPKSPGVYTRVGRYSNWILDNSVGADWCSA